MECSICLETCVQPVQLPCGHIFCFLCVKGVADRYQNCAICRRSIPDNYFEHPVLVPCEETLDLPEFDGGYQWFYEGKNGWWLYDPRTSADLEDAYKLGQPQTQLLIAGHLYYIDFTRMVQYRSAEPKKRRKIKRDARSTVTKGIAGLKACDSNSVACPTLPSAPPMSPPTSPLPPLPSLASLTISQSQISPLLSIRRQSPSRPLPPPPSPSSPSLNSQIPPALSSPSSLLSRLSFRFGNDAAISK